ncbi:hypothetical protein ACFL1I_05175 [Candidatus Omnitrophota bacterium]
MAEKFIERRKTHFIKKKFQRNFILKFCLLVTLGAVFSSALIYSMSRSTLTTTFENCRLTIKSTADFILPAVLLSAAMVVIFVGLATVFVALFTSHRIAGPLYRVEKDIQGVSSGNLRQTFNLRLSDEIKPLAESLDKMTQSLRAKISIAKDINQEMQTRVRAKGRVSKEELLKNLQGLQEALDKFNT